MKIRSCSLLLMAVFLIGCERSSCMKSVMGKTVTIDYGIAGNELLIEKRGDRYVGVRRVLGSGVPIIKEYVYSIKMVDNSAIEFGEIVSDLSKEMNSSNIPVERIRIDCDRNAISRVVINGEATRILGIR